MRVAPRGSDATLRIERWRHAAVGQSRRAVLAVTADTQLWGLCARGRLLMLAQMPAYRVFLCDDDDAYRSLLRIVLSDSGMEIVGEGGDGAECIAAVEKAAPDVVLLDLNMPGMNGFEALPVLRRTLPDARVVVLSTAPDGASASAAYRLGAHGYLPKPIDIFELPDLLHDLLAADKEPTQRAAARRQA